MDIKKTNWKLIGLSLGLAFICLAPTIMLVSNGLNYLFIAFVAFLSLASFAIMLMSQKRISIYSVTALAIGLLLLTSSIIEFGYRPFELNMSISEKSKLYTILRPPQISLAFSQIGMGIFFILFGFRQITTTNLPTRNTQVYRMIYIAQISVGVLLFISGIYQVINGLYPSAYELYRFSDVGQMASIICFGFLTLWYMVAKPIIVKRRNMAALNNKSA